MGADPTATLNSIWTHRPRQLVLLYDRETPAIVEKVNRLIECAASVPAGEISLLPSDHLKRYVSRMIREKFPTAGADVGVGWYDRVEPGQRRDYRNGYYQRQFVTRWGTIWLRMARTRGKNFLPRGLEKFQRRAEDVALLIREAFLRGVSTRQVGRLVATFTGEPVSAQTVSKLTRDLDAAVQEFHRAPRKDEWAYLFLDGVSLRVRRPAGRKRVQMLMTYGVRQDGSRGAAGLPTQSGRKPGDVGRLAGEPVPTGSGGHEPGAHCDRWLSGSGCGHPGGLPARAAPALLGAQDAQYSGEGAQAGL